MAALHGNINGRFMKAVLQKQHLYFVTELLISGQPAIHLTTDKSYLCWVFTPGSAL